MQGRHRVPRRALPAVAAFTATLGLAGAAPALASTASVDGNTLRIAAAAGEVNTISVRRAIDEAGHQVIHVRDADGTTAGPNQTVPGVPIDLFPGAGCQPVDDHEVKCTSSGMEFSLIDAKLGDGADQFFDTLGTLPLPGMVVDGQAGSDYLSGSANNDLLIGGDGNDELFGEGGDDRLQPGAGTDDDVQGGTGEDRVIYSERTTAVTVTLDGVANDGAPGEQDNLNADIEAVDGGAGNDVLIGNDGANRLIGYGGNDRIEGRGGDDPDLAGGDGDDRILGEAGNDAIRAGEGADTVDGSDGNDDILSGPGRNTVTAGAGDDTVVAGDDADSISGGAGKDSIQAGHGDNFVDGGDGDDFLTANDQKDRVLGGAGNDVIRTNGDDDVIVGGAGADSMDPGPGTDTISYEEKTAPVFAEVAGNKKYGTNCLDQSSPLCEGDTIVVTAAENLIGGSGDDRLVGDGGANQLDGRAGDDTLVGALGADTIRGGDGFDLVSYAERTNPVTVTLDGAAGDGESGENDNLFGDLERVEGGSGKDTLIGSGGLNELIGNGGDDTLDGKAGPDKLDGGAGTDLVTYAGRAQGLAVSIDDAANDGAGGEGDNVTSTVENVTGGDANDTLIGSAGANELNGGKGDDTLDGLRGADKLTGGDGTDTASYGGRSASETVSVKLDDVSNDGAPGEGDNVQRDVENLTGGPERDSFLGSAAGNVLTGGGGDDTLDGAQGDDRILGGAGADALDGGDGRDTLVPGLGADNVAGGPMTDTADYGERSGAVSVTFDETANDGEAGEGDNVRTNVERATLPGGQVVVNPAAPAEPAAGSDSGSGDAGSGSGGSGGGSGSATPVGTVTGTVTGVTGGGSSSSTRSAAGGPALTATIAPATRRGGRLRFVVTGRLVTSGQASAAARRSCAGKVLVTVKRGTRTLAKRTVALSRGCTFRAPFAVRASKGALSVQARFLGNRKLRPVAVTRRLSVR